MGVSAGAELLLDAGAIGGDIGAAAAAGGAIDAGVGAAGAFGGFDAIGALGAGGGDALAAGSDSALAALLGSGGAGAADFGLRGGLGATPFGDVGAPDVAASGGLVPGAAGGADLAAGALGTVGNLTNFGAPGGLTATGGGTPYLGSSLGSGLNTGGLGATAGGISAAGPGAAGAGGGLSGLTDFLSANKSLILPGALEAGSLLTKPKIPFQGNLQALAQPSAGGTAAGNLATSLIPTVQTGNLPPGAQTAVSNAVQDSITSIKAKYAQMGLSGSSMEAQDIASAQARGQSMSFDLANQLTQTGLQAADVSEQDLANQENIYALLMNSQLQTDEQLSGALANFASASALGAGLAAGK